MVLFQFFERLLRDFMEVLNDDTQVRLSNGVDVDVCLPLFFYYFYSGIFFADDEKHGGVELSLLPPTSSRPFMIEAFMRAVEGGD